MKKALAFATRFYGSLISFYPREFLSEFRDEMVSAFAAMLREAAGQGAFTFTRVCLRELWDIPGSVLWAHLNGLKGVNNMQKWLHSQPVHLSVRCGAGFGISFLIFNVLLPILEQSFPLRNVGVNTSEALLFYTFAWISAVDVVACLILGIIIATAFGEIRHPQRFLVLAAIWFIFPNIVDLFIRWLSGEWYQLPASTPIYNIVFFALTGAYLGVAINPWPKDRRKALQFIIAGAIGLPLARKVPLPWVVMAGWNPALKYGLYWAIVGLVIGALLGMLSAWSASRQNLEVPA